MSVTADPSEFAEPPFGQPQFPAPDFRRAGRAEAAAMVEVIHAAFGARPALDPPSTADQETAETVAAAVARGAGLLGTVAGRPAGSLIISAAPDDHDDDAERPATGEVRTALFQRVSVHPDFQRHGVASAMVAHAELLAAELGFGRVEVYARVEFPALIDYWRHRGFVEQRRDPHGVWLARALPLRVEVPDADAMQALGGRLAGVLRGGDLVILSGALGAGKTTLTQGIGAGLDSDGAIISPTFVISRRHTSRTGRPTLVHVDAYRLGSGAELDDLGLDADIDADITVIEWGEELAEMLAADRLEILIDRDPVGVTGATAASTAGVADGEALDGAEPRTVWVDAVGDDWQRHRLDSLIRAVGGAA